MVLGHLFRWKRARPRVNEAREALSLIVLSNTHVALTVERLLATLNRLYPGEFLPPRQNNFVIDGAVPGATFFIQCSVPGARGTFMMHSVRGRYTDVSDFARHIADRRLRQRAEAQACWMSVDLRGRHGNAGKEEPYRLIGALLATLAPADSAFVVDLATSAIVAFSDEVRDRLARGDRIFPI